MSTKESRGRLSRKRLGPSHGNLTPMSRAPENTLPNALSEVSSKIWDLAKVKAFTINAVEEILEKRRVPKHQICSPSLEITIPAIEAMRYSPLRHEIAALIASTMDREYADVVHPSFLNILQQLTADEVQILSNFPGTGRVLPMAHLWMTLSDAHAEVLYRNIVPPDLADLCNNKQRLPLYIDNMIRLKLLHEPEGVKIADRRIYSNLMRQRFCRRILEQPNIRRNSSLEKHTLALSAVGDTFRKVCLL